MRRKAIKIRKMMMSSKGELVLSIIDYNRRRWLKKLFFGSYLPGIMVS